jgi:hypothetical protein
MSKDEERYDVSQHDGITEGPWKIEGARRIEGKSDLRIVVKGGISREANLQFIASSPEILDALKKAYEEVDNLEWLLAKAHGEGNMVHSLVHLGVTQQLEVSKTENERLRDALHVINEDMKDCEEGGMPHVRKIANFVNDVCESEKIASE